MRRLIPPLSVLLLAAAANAAGRPWVGIAMEEGAPRVRQVIRTSPADRGGIRVGDEITKVGDVKVSSSSEVIRKLRSQKVGERVVLVVRRGEHDVTLPVTTDEFPTPEAMLRMQFVSAPAPTWKGVTRMLGKEQSLESLSGRVVILDFFATWCVPCRWMQPKLSEMDRRFRAEGLSVVGISSEDREVLAPYLERVRPTHSVFMDAKGETTAAYSVTSLPTLFVIDKRGVVRQAYVGFDTSRDKEMEELVQRLLAEPSPKGP